MSFLEAVRTMDRRLRVVAIATALLLVPLIGQFVAASDIRRHGHESDLALFFMFAAIFIVPTAIILSGAVLSGIRSHWAAHKFLAILGLFNIVLSFELIWFFIQAQ